VVSPAGKEVTIPLLSAGDFVAEEALAGIGGLRLATATAITACTALRTSRDEMIHVMHLENSFSDLFLKVLLQRNMRIQADLVDQCFKLQRKASCADTPVNGGIWKAGRTGTVYSQDFAEDPGRNDRHHALPRELLHESISQTRIHRVITVESRFTNPC
jgi:hypothetical protein